MARGGKRFDATLTLKRRAITGRSLARVPMGYPLMTVKVITMIHWQALRLWVKGGTGSHPPRKTRAPAAEVNP